MNETALKERIKAIAKDRDVSFNEVWKQLLLERFLARLSKSKHHERFIFKGGLLLAQYLEIGRETIDIDFLVTKIKSETPVIEAAFHDIIAANTKDGFQFSWVGIEELTQPHMDYTGYRVNLNIKLGKMNDQIQVDIGVGDVVTPAEESFRSFEYRGKPIFEGEISLLVYPVETIFAEKLETIISKGAINSRMKDYHDLVLLTRAEGLLDHSKLSAAITDTFQNRGTDLKLPITFDETGLAELQKLWTNHLRGLGSQKQKLNLPDTIQGALNEINTWLSANSIAGKAGNYDV